MSALTITPPNKKYAPAAYKKYYDGYDPKLLEEIEKEWMLCNRRDFMKSTPIKYARLAQLYFKNQLEEKEMKNMSNYKFVRNFDARPYADLKDIDSFANLLARHIDRLIEIVENNYKVKSLDEIKLDITWYNRSLNNKTSSVKTFKSLIKDKDNKYFNTLEYSKCIFRWMQKDSDPVILDLLYGWSVYPSNNGERIFIEMEYRDGYKERIEELRKEDLEKWKEHEERRLNRNPYGYGPGSYNGD